MELRTLIIVNRLSERYREFEAFILPYLKVFGVPMRIMDRSDRHLAQSILAHPLIIIGHEDIQAQGGDSWSTKEEDAFREALQAGCGIVNFDPASMETFGIGSRLAGCEIVSKLKFSTTRHYITLLHEEDIKLKSHAEENLLRLPVVAPDSQAVKLLEGEQQPLLMAKNDGCGRIVQWTSYQWIAESILGTIAGMDDLMWRSLVWAARKPFVMREIPPFATLRVDDCVGQCGHYKNDPFGWVDIANKYGFKPWLGFFYETITDAAVDKMKQLTRGGMASVQFHGMYLFGTVYKPIETGAEIIRRIMQAWMEEHQWKEPLSIYFIPHNYDISEDALTVIQEFGVQVIGLPYQVNSGGGARDPNNKWLQSGPYRLLATGTDGIPWSGRKQSASIYYSDWLSTQDRRHGTIFNVLTEIRDVNGYEWFNYGDSNEQYEDIDAAIKRGIDIFKRCYESKIMGNLFTHENTWRGKFIANIPPDSWEKMLGGIAAYLSLYRPRFVLLDEAVQYIKALYTSAITEIYLQDKDMLKISVAGECPVSTELAIYDERDGVILKEWATCPPFEREQQFSIPLPVRQPPMTDSLLNDLQPHEIVYEEEDLFRGFEFEVMVESIVDAIKMFVPSTSNHEHHIELWHVDERRPLYTASWKINQDAQGWQRTVLSEEVVLVPNVKYVLAISSSYKQPEGYGFAVHPHLSRYPLDKLYFMIGHNHGITYPRHHFHLRQRTPKCFFRDISVRPQFVNVKHEEK
ncbi:DUF4082 domain-containing protein [Xylanibacillus composti]|uniref:DUF4082 domain-containing protein n=1 Tax=Xylanibacillus composti TaxID=1572762 RepID=UPI0028F6D4BD|nr:DUF4082 domain-containing protein [Xylanibacillus composti]